MSEVVLRDLQSVLRQQLGEELIVENYSTEFLLPPGENYGSTMLAVEALIKKNKITKAETLYLVAKMVPPTKFQREVFDSGFTFKKESFLYTDILPCYKELEMEFGMKENEIFDIGAKFYGSRFSSNPEVDFDDDAVILLENLKIRGYYTGDRILGLEVEQARVAIRALAKFHALGIAVKYKRPDQFEIFKARCKCLELKPEAFEGMKDAMMKNLRSDPVINKYTDKWEPLLELDTESWTGIPPEPWSTIIHSDFWVNNMMFHKNANGENDDIKFVDFQNYLFQNPLNEIIFFICASVVTDLIPSNIDSFLDLYYETFVATLERMECDISLFSREKFDEKVKQNAHKEFSHCAFMLKVLTIDVEKDGIDTSKLNILDFQTVNDTFFDRMRKLLLLFMDRDWI